MKDDAALIGVRGVWVWVPRLPMIRPWAYLVGSAIALLWTMWREKPDVMLWFDSPGQIAPLICAGVMRCPYVLFVNGVAGEELTGLWGWKPIRNRIQGSSTGIGETSTGDCQCVSGNSSLDATRVGYRS